MAIGESLERECGCRAVVRLDSSCNIKRVYLFFFQANKQDGNFIIMRLGRNWN